MEKSHSSQSRAVTEGKAEGVMEKCPTEVQEKKEIYKLSKHDALRARRSAIFRVQHSLACGDAV